MRAEEHAVLVRLGPEVRVDGPGRVIPAASLTPITACTRNCRAFGSPESSARQAAHHEPTPCAESENRNKSTLKLRARARVDTSKPRCKHGVCLQVAPPPSRRFGQPSRFNEGLPAARTAAARSGSTWSRAEPRTRSRRDAGTSTRSSKTSRTWRPARRLERLVRRRAPARRLGGPAVATLVAHGNQSLPPRPRPTRPRAAGADAAAALDRPAKNRLQSDGRSHWVQTNPSGAGRRSVARSTAPARDVRIGRASRSPGQKCTLEGNTPSMKSGARASTTGLRGSTCTLGTEDTTWGEGASWRRRARPCR